VNPGARIPKRQIPTIWLVAGIWDCGCWDLGFRRETTKMTDPISDMLSRIRNAVTAKHARVDMPASKLKAEIARILQDEGYIQGYRLVEEAADTGAGKGGGPRQLIRVFLKYGPHGEK